MDRKEIAERIQGVINDNPVDGKPLTSYQLAKMNIITSATLSNILTCKVRPNKATLLKFAEYFHVSADWLMTGIEPEPSQDVPSTQVYLEIIQKLTNSLESRDKEIERLTKILENVLIVTSLPHEEIKVEKRD